MARHRRIVATITLLPARRGADGTPSWTREPGASYPRREVECVRVGQVAKAAADFAAEHGKPCFAAVSLAGNSRPDGFRKAVANLYFNIGCPEHPEPNDEGGEP